MSELKNSATVNFWVEGEEKQFAFRRMFQERYCTMKEAIDGHYRVCEQLRKGEIKV